MALQSHEGLEAWRKIRKSLAWKDAQRLEDEYSVCTKLTPIAMADLQHFNTMLTNWESEIKRFERIDAAYPIGKYQRMSIIMSALPKNIQDIIRSEKAKGQLR